MIDPKRDGEARSARPLPSVMPAWAIWVGAGVVLGVAAVTMSILFALYGSGTPADRVQLEIVKLAGSIVVGTGGAAALLLAARRQRSTELSLEQAEHDLAHKESTAANSKHDADERRATELYTAAAEQLGSDKAPVRMAGLYALERFGQANIEYRQTVVNLLCAYLRMPFQHPYGSTESAFSATPKEGSAAYISEPDNKPILIDLAPSLAAAAGLSLDGDDRLHQELEVRLTAQDILTSHLRDKDPRTPKEMFWEGMDIDLSRAVLHGLDMQDSRVNSALFTEAEFYDFALLDRVKFEGRASFRNAHFHCEADFNSAKFERLPNFNRAHFEGDAGFADAEFSFAIFDGAHFHGVAHFSESKVRSMSCHHAVFHRAALFEEAHFRARPDFRTCRFRGEAEFAGAQFERGAKFGAAHFRQPPDFKDARIRLDIKTDQRVWLPPGWQPTPPKTSDDGLLEGREGTWGYITSTDGPKEDN
ncbi:hypothetical protein E1181_06530 [Saccharopolyspora terrae]|uniref:Pentapeptide repeat-containing protein n=1 Tax=Saccharopolyspora terrae TaxID=2530384 RepID=A0A4R4VTJ5_9PSEU|nr:pentapeptide repeat-containing protein [Saccharopolyspora terrae]TDD08601.1 hypothetical protein E1181_06530 [Saccharopolyspora terrae]